MELYLKMLLFVFNIKKYMMLDILLMIALFVLLNRFTMVMKPSFLGVLARLYEV